MWWYCSNHMDQLAKKRHISVKECQLAIGEQLNGIC